MLTWPQRGRVYTVLETTLHIDRDGRPSAIITWQGICSTCSGTFTLTTGLRGRIDVTRCRDCREQAKRVRTIAARRKLVGLGHGMPKYRRRGATVA